ncbi:unnamed protein product [Eruca vesicaria subsp. sativa]|uniref:Secreted protein n=1 Tax=Eruca vesicaria subsp. sativa TaxID=29727 RepID=A0ABC8KHN9_ERUVS|nr:unnamed protein product [Eruca vesicaria subsp. sativa]
MMLIWRLYCFIHFVGYTQELVDLTKWKKYWIFTARTSFVWVYSGTLKPQINVVQDLNRVALLQVQVNLILPEAKTGDC